MYGGAGQKLQLVLHVRAVVSGSEELWPLLASGESRDDGAVTLGLFFFYMEVPWHQRRGFYSDQVY